MPLACGHPGLVPFQPCPQHLCNPEEACTGSAAWIEDGSEIVTFCSDRDSVSRDGSVELHLGISVLEGF